MNWNYIAGFVDGEGCFTLTPGNRNNAAMRFTVGQVEDNSLVLDLIADAFEEAGISYSWSFREASGRKQPFWTLIVSQQESVRKLCLKLLPFLVVKRVDAEASLEFVNSKLATRKTKAEICSRGHQQFPGSRYKNRACKECAKQDSREQHESRAS